VEFNKAAACLTPEDVYNMIPRIYPKANPVKLADFEAFPGLGRFDYEQWMKDDQPVLTTAGWCQLAMKIASNDLGSLTDVFTTAEQYLVKKGLVYKKSGARDEVGPLTHVVHVDVDF